jgi:hypothetical protein
MTYHTLNSGYVECYKKPSVMIKTTVKPILASSSANKTKTM